MQVGRSEFRTTFACQAFSTSGTPFTVHVFSCSLYTMVRKFTQALASKKMNGIRIGSCGWSYADWSGVFYPTGLPASNFLPYYSERFGIVEVDSTFYATPRPSTVQGWRDKTPDGFHFSRSRRSLRTKNVCAIPKRN